MEQQTRTITQALPCGRTLTITPDRDAAQAARARGEIAVYDDRLAENPSFRIYDSYQIRRNSAKREVLSAMIAYDEAYPSEPRWRRTMHSLVLEWMEHNFAYRVGFLRGRASNVDLDNHAEGKGALRYFIRSAWDVIINKGAVQK